MSYDLEMVDPRTQNVCAFDRRMMIPGGTYALNGTNEAEINITYNYGEIFRQYLGPKGIREIYGKNGLETMIFLGHIIPKLEDNITDNYWDATEGNVKEALRNVWYISSHFPDGIWRGD